MREFLKVFLVTGVFFGAAMGFFIWLETKAVSEAVIWGGVAGAIFGLFMALFVTRVRKQFAGKYVSEAGETLLREGPSNHFERLAIGGYLYLTDRRVHFKPHRVLQSKAQEISIPLADIVEAAPYRVLGMIPNGLRIRTGQGEERFNLEKNKEWAQSIARAKAA